MFVAFGSRIVFDELGKVNIPMLKLTDYSITT